MEMIEKLKDFTRVFLDKSSSDDLLEKTTKELTEFFEKFSCVKIQKNIEDIKEESKLSKGIAVSSELAAMCALEPLRVAYFLRGVKKAIDDLLDKKKDKPIYILYAGSGPYGTLLTPLLPLFTSKEIQVTILDYHKESLDSLKNILNKLNLNGYVKDLIQTDAATYKHPKGETLDIVLSETMTAALQKEMQVPISLNLSPLLDKKSGILIPQNIAVKGKLLSLENAFIKMGSDSKWKEGDDLGVIFEINKEKAIELSSYIDEAFLPANKITMPSDIKKDKHPFLITEITVYDDIKLFGYESTLNHPVGFPGQTSCKPDSRIEFIYKLDDNPALAVKGEI